MTQTSPTRKTTGDEKSRDNYEDMQESCEAALQGQGQCYGCPVTDEEVTGSWDAVITNITMAVIILGLIGNFLSVWVLSSTASSRFSGKERLESQIIYGADFVTC